MVLDTVIWCGIFGLSLTVLIKASDFFTDSAEKIGLMFGISPFIIGVTIVSIGTSLPELITSFIAVADGVSEIVPGNVIGSNIANICLILGIGAVAARKLKIDFNLLSIDMPILIGSTFLVSYFMWDGQVTRVESLLLVAGYVIYFMYTLSSDAKENQNTPADEPPPVRSPRSIKPLIILIISGGFIFLGAKFTVVSITRLSEIFNIGKEIISVTAVALGTSLPELMVTISAVKKKNSEMIVGNVLGSNIFNAFAVTGFPGLIGGLRVEDSMRGLAIPIFFFATVLFLVSVLDKKITRWEGSLFILFYVFFIGRTFHLF